MGRFRLLVALMEMAVCVLACGAGHAAVADEPAVHLGSGGALVYREDDLGDRIPDFSSCGYAGGDREIPDVAIRQVIEPGEGDDGARIQTALDQIAALPLDQNGFRGALLLAPGEYQIEGQLTINASGVVLRGSGATADGTKLIATGRDRRALVRLAGSDDREPIDTEQVRLIVDDYVAVGASEVHVADAAGFHAGDAVVVTRPSSAEWIKLIGADALGVGWRPGSRDVRWMRTIAAVNGNKLALDAPITTAIDATLGGGTVEPLVWPGRIENVGVENLVLESAYDEDRPHDEDHAWHGVTVENVRNAWVRRVECRGFAGGAVAVWETASRITVEDCLSLAPVAEVGGHRRLAFFTQGQQTLFLRCWSERGLHDFATGHCAAGPNAFVNCYAAETHGDSGPMESWSSGVLFDNVRIDGGGLHLENRWTSPPGCGWAAANSVIWQCQAATIRCFRPPAANNWALGVWASLAGDGVIEGEGDFLKPLSLFQAQFRERRGDGPAARIDPLLLDPIGSTNPTAAEAAEFTRLSADSPRELIDVIRERMQAAAAKVPVELQGLAPALPHSDLPKSGREKHNDASPLRVQNGWLTVGDRVALGRTLTPKWWAGNIRPHEAPTFGPAITRFVPGRVGAGFTDDLPTLAARMARDGTVAYDHHYGLWYDRRRDNHTHVRQADGEVTAPFYEQPFARTGRAAEEGAAWDGLSRYDLTRFNPWYWDRLRDFAGLCDDHGLVLLHQNYFQHNILEAGAHWADSPWRSANNVNGPLPFPEPPHYIGDKRIFNAEMFYDVDDPSLRALHRGYIRQCLDNFAGRSNVVQLTSGEFSGPRKFVEFWIDVITEWEREKDRDVLVGLSAPKNVQDAILTDRVRSEAVDVIDIRYWAYTADDGLYAPHGGENLAPRQHLRQTRLKPGGAAAIVRAVSEYRRRYPKKAVTYYADRNCPSIADGWAVLVGGGSLANVPRLPEELTLAIPTMLPSDDTNAEVKQWMLSLPEHHYLVYVENADEAIELELLGKATRYRVNWINAKTGQLTAGEEVAGGRMIRLQPQSKVVWISRVD